MSSSCVPPKNCVIHDPDPSGHDDHSDTSSDCGSLCTCTSTSMASIATIDRTPERDSSSLVAPPSTYQIVPQTPEVRRDPRYDAVRVPQRTASRRERSRCSSTCQRSHALADSLRHFLLSMSEFLPWVAGFVVIYYSYCWWGMGSGFTAFLFMIGAHAVIRLIKTRGALGCVPYSQTHVESSSPSVSTHLSCWPRRCCAWSVTVFMLTVKSGIEVFITKTTKSFMNITNTIAHF